MREIKFRAWDGEKMLFLENAHFEITYCGVCVVRSEWSREGIKKDWPLMQFTGLQDKNGNDIYEGDRLGGGSIDPFEVVFEDGAFRSRHAWTNTSSPVLVQDRTKRLEIIGNIHQHPELLGDDDE